MFKAALVLLGIVSAAPHSSDIEEFNTDGSHNTDSAWSYVDNGANWGEKSAKSVKNNECGSGVTQSPIDLKTSWATIPASKDRFQRVYTDQVGNIQVNWNGHTSQIAVDKTGQDIQSFYSEVAGAIYNGPKRYNGIQFHFHSESEHTVDGKRFPLEMHTVHLPYDGDKPIIKYSGFIAAAQGIIFSNDPADLTRQFTDEEIKTIDNFFDALQWNVTSTNPKVPLVPYGQLKQMIDMSQRYVYKGSVTTPPCATAVYWNVMTTVYPVKTRHLEQFKNQLNREAGMKKTGNYRVIQPTTFAHQPFIVQKMPTTVQSVIQKAKDNQGLLIACIILVVIIFGLCIYVIQGKGHENKKGGDQEMSQI